MSEEDRSRIYAWLCDEMDEQRAEYLMSCLSPIPLPELATKDDLADLRAATKDDLADLRAATKDDLADLRAATKADLADLRAATKADFGKLFDLREADRAERAREREADLAESRSHFRWVVGIVCGFGTAIVGFGIALLVAVLQTGAVA